MLDNIDLEKMTQEEKNFLFSIIDQFSKEGSSSSLDDLWNVDYIEKPVSIYEFLINDDYLGKSLKNEQGQLTVYDYWVDKLSQIFDPDNKITQEVALSGCIGSGKSTCAVIGLAYILYKLLCLRNPTSYYNLNKSSKIAIAFFNVTLNQSYGVGYSRLQQYCQASPWFKRHGEILGNRYPTYYPKGIEILVGSRKEHFIGRDIFCLEEGTLIETEDGIFPIESLCDNPRKIFTYSENPASEEKVCLSESPVYSVLQGYAEEMMEIELEDGTIISCTPDHLFLDSEGNWIKAENLSEENMLLSVS